MIIVMPLNPRYLSVYSVYIRGSNKNSLSLQMRTLCTFAWVIIMTYNFSQVLAAECVCKKVFFKISLNRRHFCYRLAKWQSYIIFFRHERFISICSGLLILGISACHLSLRSCYNSRNCLKSGSCTNVTIAWVYCFHDYLEIQPHGYRSHSSRNMPIYDHVRIDGNNKMD